MEKKIFVLVFLLLILTQVLVLAADAPVPAGIWGEKSILGPIMKFVFGITGDMDGNEMAIMFAVWLIFFLAASDIIRVFTMFNAGIAWFIGFALAVILANTTANYQIAKAMFGLAATMGTIGIALILIGAFLAAMLFHFGVSWGAGWLIRARIAAKANVSGEEIVQGFRLARRVGHDETAH